MTDELLWHLKWGVWVWPAVIAVVPFAGGVVGAVVASLLRWKKSWNRWVQLTISALAVGALSWAAAVVLCHQLGAWGLASLLEQQRSYEATLMHCRNSGILLGEPKCDRLLDSARTPKLDWAAKHALLSPFHSAQAKEFLGALLRNREPQTEQMTAAAQLLRQDTRDCEFETDTYFQQGQWVVAAKAGSHCGTSRALAQAIEAETHLGNPREAAELHRRREALGYGGFAKELAANARNHLLLGQPQKAVAQLRSAERDAWMSQRAHCVADAIAARWLDDADAYARLCEKREPKESQLPAEVSCQVLCAELKTGADRIAALQELSLVDLRYSDNVATRSLTLGPAFWQDPGKDHGLESVGDGWRDVVFGLRHVTIVPAKQIALVDNLASLPRDDVPPASFDGQIARLLIVFDAASYAASMGRNDEALRWLGFAIHDARQVEGYVRDEHELEVAKERLESLQHWRASVLIKAGRIAEAEELVTALAPGHAQAVLQSLLAIERDGFEWHRYQPALAAAPTHWFEEYLSVHNPDPALFLFAYPVRPVELIHFASNGTRHVRLLKAYVRRGLSNPCYSYQTSGACKNRFVAARAGLMKRLGMAGSEPWLGAAERNWQAACRADLGLSLYYLDVGFTY